jgi:hypothetical protein
MSACSRELLTMAHTCAPRCAAGPAQHPAGNRTTGARSTYYQLRRRWKRQTWRHARNKQSLTVNIAQIRSLFGWLVADVWCWFVLREEYYWLVAGDWFVVRGKYC